MENNNNRRAIYIHAKEALVIITDVAVNGSILNEVVISKKSKCLIYQVVHYSFPIWYKKNWE